VWGSSPAQPSLGTVLVCLPSRRSIDHEPMPSRLIQVFFSCRIIPVKWSRSPWFRWSFKLSKKIKMFRFSRWHHYNYNNYKFICLKSVFLYLFSLFQQHLDEPQAPTLVNQRTKDDPIYPIIPARPAEVGKLSGILIRPHCWEWGLLGWLWK
jgi:hypothetical protein